MIRKMKKLLLFTLSVMFLTVLAQDKQTLPDLVLKNLEGKNQNVKDYGSSGKLTIISFWATWCSPCVKELSNINNVYDDWKANYNVQLIAVTVDNAKNTMKVKPFVDGKGWEYDVLFDSNEDLKRALNVPSVPYTLLIDKAGKIVYTHNGYVEGDEFELEKKLKEYSSK